MHLISSFDSSVPLRISTAGLVAEDQSVFASLLDPSLRATFVNDRTYNVLVVDPTVPNFGGLLRERVVGATVVVACGPNDREFPGTSTIRRPFIPAEVNKVLRDVSTVVNRRASVLGDLGGGSPSVPARNTGSLLDLASRYRFGLARQGCVTITINGSKFILFPQRYFYRSGQSAECLAAFRNDTALQVDVVVSDHREGTMTAEGPLRRLDEFLWNLGYHSQSGKLLPWLNNESAYKLTRWPPVARRDNDSSLLRMGTLMARKTLRPADLSKAAGAKPATVADFLNGCSLAGCLESWDTGGVEPKQPQSNPKNEFMWGLLGRIRMKLGLS